MELKFHAITRKKWGITDTKFFHDKEEYPIDEIKSIEIGRYCNGALGEGQVWVTLKNRKSFILYFNYKERTNARDAVEFVQKLLPEEDKPKPVKSVFRKRCKLCGAVYSYTLSDIKQNELYIKQAQLSAVNALTQSIGGTHIGAALNANQASAANDKVRDFSRCPKCNSTDIADISDEEFKQMQNAPQPATVSAADELKKFKELLDMGAISQEEYDAKKKQLLGI